MKLKFTPLLLSLWAVMGSAGLASAQATRNDVILEVATGTWCQYGPGAALSADELFNSGAHVGIVEHPASILAA